MTFVWSRPSGYMASCWRALGERIGVEVSVVVGRPAPANDNAPFARDVLAGIDHRLVDDLESIGELEAAVEPTNPDVLVLGGWQHQGISELAVHRGRLGVEAVVMAMDNPHRFTGHGSLLSVRHRRYLRCVDAIWVPGERARRLATEIRTRSGLVFTGLYGVDPGFRVPAAAAAATATAATATAATEPWPASFLFTGQYVPRKGLDVLIDAYRGYRSAIEDPWPLSTAGTGELASLVANEPGVTDLGFIQPGDQPMVVAGHGVAVVPSRVDPWPLVVVEAALAGRPVILTDACGSGVEVVRDGWNGLVVPAGSAAALGEAMQILHRRRAELPEWGRRSETLASPYAATEWADRGLVLLRSLRHSVGAGSL